MKTKTIFLIAIAAVVLFMCSCSENYGNGKKFGTINKFSKEGLIWDTYEGHLNSTQTGMNSSGGIDFSLDRDHQPEGLINKLDSAAQHGWIVELDYHQVKGWNWLNNRGNTNIFVTDCKVMQRNTNSNGPGFSTTQVQGIPDSSGTYKTVEKIIDRGIGYSDTLYVIILGADRKPIDFSKISN